MSESGISNDPAYWPLISSFREYNYFSVAALTVMIYDWALTFGQEFELVWRQRWSLMTILYLSVRYIGIFFSVYVRKADNRLSTDKSSHDEHRNAGKCISSVDRCSSKYQNFLTSVNFIVPTLLAVIIITQLHAMYQRSRKVLIFLVLTFLVIQITIKIGVMFIPNTVTIFAVPDVLSGIRVPCLNETNQIFLTGGYVFALVFDLAWQILVLCLAIRIAVKHFRELQRAHAGWGVGDCFTVLIKTHVFYFASFAVQSSFSFLSPTLIFYDALQIVYVVQWFVLGPRLILGIREYHAKLVADSDGGTGMTSIAFQERVHISTGSSV